MLGRYLFKLSIKGPFLTRSNAFGKFGIDAPIARRTNDDKPYIPGTLVLGRLAEAMRQLGDAQSSINGDKSSFHEILVTFFAAPGNGHAAAGDAEFGRARRRRIFVSDLVMGDDSQSKKDDSQSELRDDGHRKERVRVRNAIDPVMGSVKSGALQVIEAPFAVGKIITFEGEIRLLGTNDAIANAKAHVELALNWIVQWGALRSVGYGEAADATYSIVLKDVGKSRGGNSGKADGSLANPPVASAGPEQMRLVLTLHDLLCVGERQTAPNIFESSDVIPGSVIRGALANQIMAQIIDRESESSTAHFLADCADKLQVSTLQPLSKHFDAIRFGHAKPVARAGKTLPTIDPAQLAAPERIPMSWIANGEEFVDLADHEHPELAPVLAGHAPAFQPDWKNSIWAKADAKAGWPYVPSEFRVRTAIDLERRAAKSSALFGIAYRRTDRHFWVADIDLMGVTAEDRRKVADALREAFKPGLAGIGRTGAYADVRIEECSNCESVRTQLALLKADDRFVVTLQTPALLRDPNDRNASLNTIYGKAFDKLFAAQGIPAPSLVGSFVRERLSGAEFMARRAIHERSADYRPFLLTEAGATFVFKVAADLNEDGVKSIRNALASWLIFGLPIQDSLKSENVYNIPNEKIWKTCPFTPENGYGEVSIRIASQANMSDRPSITPERSFACYQIEGNLVKATPSESQLT